MRNRCLIIAEAGVNHNGDLALAKQLVEVAAQAGADLVKFQTFTANQLTTSHAKIAEYQRVNTGGLSSQLEMLRHLELSPADHEKLMAHCDSCGIGFFSSAFDLDGLSYLHSIGAQRFKVPSGEITNLPYLLRAASFGKPLILSTGMSDMGEIEDAIEAIESAGLERGFITVLHCNTEYPTPARDVNLNAMLSIQRAFGVAVGYSDHTLGTEVPIAAVALGAKVIEKHLTLDRSMSGPDHKASLEPAEFTGMVNSIRKIELAMGDGIKRPSESEKKNMSVARKSLVAAMTIRAGELFSNANVGAKRPGTGMSPMRLNEVIGRVAPRDFLIDELIEL